MIEFNNVVKAYDHGSPALNGVTMQIEDGEFCFLVGPSGSGKSTIIKLISGELRPTSGAVHVNGYNLERIRKREIPYLRRTTGVVFQDFRLFPKKTVYENVAFAMQVIGTPNRLIKQNVPIFVEAVGLKDRMDAFPNQLSGGEKQRVALARALANNPRILIADEPTGNIDPEMSLDIMNLLIALNKELGKTVLVVTHERDLVDRFQKRVVTLKDGMVESDRIGGMFDE